MCHYTCIFYEQRHLVLSLLKKTNVQAVKEFIHINVPYIALDYEFLGGSLHFLKIYLE